MKEKSITREEFYILHQCLESKCDELLLKEKSVKLSRESEALYYGYGAGKPDLEDTKTLCSIKYIILQHAGNNIKKSRIGFKNENDDSISFNGRYLKDLKNLYNQNKEGQPIPIKGNYLRAYLLFLGYSNLEEFIQKYLQENNIVPPVALPNCILPTIHSRCPQKDEVNNSKEYQAQLQEEDRTTRRLAKFENTSWYYYFYNPKIKRGQPTHIIRLIFKIGKRLANGDYPVELVKRQPPFADFSGVLVQEVSNPKIVIFHLKTKDGAVKYKQLMFHIDPRGKNLYLGQYQEYDDTYTIMSGTVIIQKVDHPEQMKAAVFQIGTNEINAEIDPHIQEYFKIKHLNFLKTKTGISSFYDLRTWLDDKIEERAKKNPIKIHDLFIAAPKSAILGNDTFQDRKNKVETMLQDKLWENMGIKNPYWGPLTFSNRPVDNSFVLKRELLAFRKSKAFLLIFMEDQPVSSSAFMELGWAIQSGKPTFIVYKKRTALPRLIRVAWVLENVVMPDAPITIEDIPNWFYANEYYKMIE